jgi:hypothetical protein
LTRRLATWSLAAGCVVACQGALLTVRLNESATTTIPAATPLEVLVGDLGFGDFVALDLTDATELQNQGVAPGDIATVRFVDFELEALSGADDLSFIDDLAFYVEAPDLPRVLVASQATFPPGEAVVSLVLEEVDLTEYVVSESMTITTEIDAARPREATEVEARFTLAVGVTGQGACTYLKGGRDAGDAASDTAGAR